MKIVCRKQPSIMAGIRKPEYLMQQRPYRFLTCLPMHAVLFSGGPHSMFSADFMLYPCALCKLGYAVLLGKYVCQFC